MPWALIVDDHVREITKEDPKDRFHPSLKWVASGPEVKEGFEFKNGKFTPPPAPVLPTPAPSADSRLADALEAAGVLPTNKREVFLDKLRQPPEVTHAPPVVPPRRNPVRRSKKG
jgi:hypothetical protein